MQEDEYGYVLWPFAALLFLVYFKQHKAQEPRRMKETLKIE